MIGHTCNASLSAPHTTALGHIQVPPSARTHRRSTSYARPSVAASAAIQAEVAMPTATGATRMKLRSLKDCELGVSIYPIFAYDASTGGGIADVTPVPGEAGKLNVVFDPQTVIIPDLSWRTASMFKIPIPPPLRIAITTQRLEGVVDTVSGQAELEFDAEFVFSAGPLYTAPPLIVRTRLTTGYTKGMFREGTGKPFTGLKGKLAGTATVEKTGDLFMDTFLMLPTDALAIMSAQLEFE